MSYLPKIFTTGAIRETPKRIIEKIADEVTASDKELSIVEVGAGMGEITRAVLNQLNGSAFNYYAFEIDEEAVLYLKEEFKAIHVLSESAFEFDKSIPNRFAIDYFISSIPLSFYKKEQIEVFLENIKSRLNTDGKFIVLFSAAWLLPIFKKHLPNLHYEAFLTFPPYFLAVYEHKGF
jgi:phospholipid N-methyltransferase